MGSEEFSCFFSFAFFFLFCSLSSFFFSSFFFFVFFFFFSFFFSSFLFLCFSLTLLEGKGKQLQFTAKMGNLTPTPSAPTPCKDLYLKGEQLLAKCPFWQAKIGGSLVGVWNGWGYGIAIFRALNFQISEPEIGNKNRSFCRIPGIFLENSASERYFSDSGKWPFHTPTIHTPTKCRQTKKALF